MMSVPQGLRKKDPHGDNSARRGRKGTRLRLKGLGKQGEDGTRGDFFLDVHLID